MYRNRLFEKIQCSIIIYIIYIIIINITDNIKLESQLGPFTLLRQSSFEICFLLLIIYNIYN